ncbi:MAG: S8 family serine peptidase [Chroococcidiopsidaceae cyanobacterium CP_BM_ER_R8_30]|nr:S8 family serine peptidase [Chroococcidiopsidaceae cyanobacterium CP_BM_ER_R8_30]
MLKKLTWIMGGASLPLLALQTMPFGEVGIDALRLHRPPYNLIGRKIAIGQVEIGRPGEFGWDKAVSQNHVIAPAGVFLRNTRAKSNKDLAPHAENVASIMISTDKALPGVAPGARLYSAAVGSLKTGSQPEECLSAQQVALQNGGDVRAINFSFGETFDRDSRPHPILDGNALLTQCVDWSARVHNVLYVVAGNQGQGGIPIPTDNYNGVNVAFTTRRQGIFDKVETSNLAGMSGTSGQHLVGRETDIGGRRAISLVAPGSDLTLINLDGSTSRHVSGTSFAAPQVTATVALLQEFGDRQLRMHQLHWSLDSRRHEVMKAVLMNSADKLKDLGNGLLLGMTKTIIDKNDSDWLASDAYHNPKIPLHAQMGAGQLNAFRAYQQFAGGEWSPVAVVPALGWDYNSVKVGSFSDYLLAQPLQQGSFVSITLAWDRLVELNDLKNDGQFAVGDSFRNRGLNRLDLYLLSAESGAVGSICASVSNVDSVQHIFCRIPKTGNYKIRVQFRQQINEATQRYALAWWTVPGLKLPIGEDRNSNRQ